MSHGESIAGASGLAILLPVPRHHDPMTLSLGGPVADISADRDALLALLTGAVAALREAVSR